MPTDEEVGARAHQLWEEAGKPEGREHEFWYQAAAQPSAAQSAGRLRRLSYDQAPFRFPAHCLERARLR
jgi:hypothetical protein